MLRIVEFSDFECPACRRFTAKVLHALRHLIRAAALATILIGATAPTAAAWSGEEQECTINRSWPVPVCPPDEDAAKSLRRTLFQCKKKPKYADCFVDGSYNQLNCYYGQGYDEE